MINKSKFFAVFLIMAIAILEINLGMAINDDDAFATRIINKSVNSKSNDNIDRIAINKKFQEIKNIPYNEKTMNCKHKSELFAKYLAGMGATEIHIVLIQHNSGTYSHEFVEWNGLCYDSCYSGLSYQLTKEDYMSKLHKIGFNGIVVESPY